MGRVSLTIQNSLFYRVVLAAGSSSTLLAAPAIFFRDGVRVHSSLVDQLSRDRLAPCCCSPRLRLSSTRITSSSSSSFFSSFPSHPTLGYAAGSSGCCLQFFCSGLHTDAATHCFCSSTRGLHWILRFDRGAQLHSTLRQGGSALPPSYATRAMVDSS